MYNSNVENNIEEKIKTQYKTAADGKTYGIISVTSKTDTVPLTSCIYHEFVKGITLTVTFAGMFAGHQANKTLMGVRERLCKENQMDFLVQMYKNFQKGFKLGDSIEIYHFRLIPIPYDAKVLEDFKDALS